MSCSVLSCASCSFHHKYCTNITSSSVSSSTTIMSASDADWDKNNLLALLQTDKPDWDLVQKRIESHVFEEAFLTDPLTKCNALHLIVLRRRTCPDFGIVLEAMRAILAQNSEAAVACEASQGLTPLAIVCDTTHENYALPTSEEAEECLQQDADLIAELHKENDLAMDTCSKQGLPPLAVHIVALSRFMRLRLDQENVDVSVSPVLELLLEKASLQDCRTAINTLYLCNTTVILKHYSEEEDRARKGLPSQGLENGWWLLDCLVQLLFGAHMQLYRGQTITHFSPLHTVTALVDCPLPLFFIIFRASSASDLQKPDRASGNLPIHNVANWELPVGDPVTTRKSVALTTLLHAYPDSEGIRNKDGETPTDLYYRKTNVLAVNEAAA